MGLFERKNLLCGGFFIKQNAEFKKMINSLKQL